MSSSVTVAATTLAPAASVTLPRIEAVSVVCAINAGARRNASTKAKRIRISLLLSSGGQAPRLSGQSCLHDDCAGEGLDVQPRSDEQDIARWQCWIDRNRLPRHDTRDERRNRTTNYLRRKHDIVRTRAMPDRCDDPSAIRARTLLLHARAGTIAIRPPDHIRIAIARCFRMSDSQRRY